MTDYLTSWWKKIGETDWQDYDNSPGHWKESIFQHIGGKKLVLASDLPVGALFAMEREKGIDPNSFPPVGYDGLSIVCVLLGEGQREDGRPRHRHWMIDYKASNCTKKDDKVHRCWVRHGTVGDKLTVDKKGNTCSAGAGSIYMNGNKWHGFLRNGILVEG